MSDNQTVELEPSQTMKSRRIDGPHTVGALQLEHSPALVLELADVGAGAATLYQPESLDFSDEPASSLDHLLELDESLDAREEQLETQAGQLASHLQNQLRELEYREALQNARAAELDNEFRRARLWITEKSAELRAERERLHEEEQADLSKERAAIREELETELSGRAVALSQGEELLAGHVRELNKDCQALAQERADWQRQKTADREAIALHRHRTETELEQHRTRLAARETALDQQQGALEQLRGEITVTHRQSIEMRLMAEQLWAQVQGRMPPVEITQSIAQLRLKLAEQYRLEQQGLAEQKAELLRLAEKVAEQSGTLRTQRQELQTWFAAREEEIERHAKLLVTREQELLEQSDQLREMESCWNSQRRQLEQKVREMHSRMRQAA